MKTTKLLKKLIKESDNNLEIHVAEWILERSSDYENGAEGVLNDLFRGGCQSGFVNHLIYFVDTKQFFNDFEGEIDDLKCELEQELGENLEIKSPITNWLAWFGFEEMARKIADKIGIEI